MTGSRIIYSTLCVALLLVMLAQMVTASPLQSAAFDEGYSITYGYAYWRTGDVRLSRGQNPPLTNLLIALPLLMRRDITLPLDHPTWAAGDVYGFSDEFLWKANPDPHRLVMMARWPAMAMALLLACLVYTFSRALFGKRAALAALFLCAFDPNILAHGHITGTDLGVTLFTFGAIWGLTMAVKQTSPHRAVLAGLMAGAALATKYSAVWLGPIAVLIGLVYPAETSFQSTWLDRIKLLVAFGLAALLVIWATFSFSLGPIWPGGPVVPAPDYWASAQKVSQRVESGTPAFMLGRISPTGFLGYYPLVFLLKTPLPTLLCMIVGIASLLRHQQSKLLAIGSLPALFLAVAMLNNLSLGYRLILPILPFVIVLAGRGAAAISLTRVTRPLIAAVAIWLAIDTLSIAPEHIAYFNLLVGDRDRAYDVLVDSNLDWGQGLIALRQWMNAQGIDSINLSYFGTARSNAYRIKANLLPSFPLNDFGPEVDGFNAWALGPGWYAISATSLRLGLLYTHWDLYAPFRARAPDARVGRSILVYRLEYSSSQVNRAVVWGLPAGDLDLTVLGGQPGQQWLVKWAGDDAAIVDMNGRARYVMRQDAPFLDWAPEARDTLMARAQPVSGDLRLFDLDARGSLDAKINTLTQARVIAPNGSPITFPIEFEEGLSLLGYDLTAAPGRPIDLVTYWQVRQRITEQAAIFAHALDKDGQILAQRDGLNVRLSALEPGDIFLRYFAIDHRAGTSQLAIGLYDPSNGRRMSMRVSNVLAADHVILPVVDTQ